MTDDPIPRPPLEDRAAADRAVNAAWAAMATELSEEFGFEILWCRQGFELPDGKGGIVHRDSPTAVRAFLGGKP